MLMIQARNRDKLAFFLTFAARVAVKEKVLHAKFWRNDSKRTIKPLAIRLR